MELRLHRFKEARTTAEPFTKDPLLSRSKYHQLGLYYLGFAAFQQQEFIIAGRTLNQLTPFNDPIFGLHAHYLLGRVFQTTGELAEAAVAYDGVLKDYVTQKTSAVESLKHPEQFKNNSAEKVRLEALVRTPPEAVAGAMFYLGSLQYEAGKFAEALGKFQAFAKDFPTSVLQPEAVLRVGFCQVQLKQFADAEKTLAPLIDKQPKLADQAAFWLGKSQVGFALTIDPARQGERDNGIRKGIATLRNAAERSNQLAGQGDAEAKRRKYEALLEAADAMQLVKQYREAGDIYTVMLAERGLPQRTEELIQREMAAWHLAGDWPRSDNIGANFMRQYPESPLLGMIMFRMAENAYFNALAASKRPDVNREIELPRLFGEAEKRYKLLIEKFPEFEKAALARYGLAMTYFHRNMFEEARQILEKIPAAERVGDLGQAPYLLAECYLREAPAKADDALTANKLQETLESAAKELDAYLAGNPKSPESPDAFLKLGYCQTRLAMLNANINERNQALNIAKQTYDKLTQQFPNGIASEQAVLERAKVIFNLGNPNGGIDELRTIHPRSAAEERSGARGNASTRDLAARAKQGRGGSPDPGRGQAARYEPILQKEPDKIALLRYHHGVCLQEAGKLPEARMQFDAVVQMPTKTAITGEASLRQGQCMLAEGRKEIEQARQKLAQGGLKPEQQAPFRAQLQKGFNMVRDAADLLERRAQEFREILQVEDARSRMLYEAAWGWRNAGDFEVEQALNQAQTELQQKLIREAQQKLPPGSAAPNIPMPVLCAKMYPCSLPNIGANKPIKRSSLPSRTTFLVSREDSSWQKRWLSVTSLPPPWTC